MILIHEIDGQPFVAERLGRRDVMHTLRDYCAGHQLRADEFDAWAEELAVDLKKARRAIELAAVSNRPTAPLNFEADNLQSRIDQAKRDAATCRNAISEAKHVHDSHMAMKAAQAEVARLEALTAPLTVQAGKPNAQGIQP
jgi:sugar diacid utilization regulator